MNNEKMHAYSTCLKVFFYAFKWMFFKRASEGFSNCFNLFQCKKPCFVFQNKFDHLLEKSLKISYN